MNDINRMTRKQFEAVPRPSTSERHMEGITLIILPHRRLHDSGFRCMSFILRQKDDVLWQIGGCSDVIHIDGIGGMGFNWLEKHGSCPRLVPPSGWSIDCLPTSGLLQLWPSSRKVIVEVAAYSSFEMYGGEKL